MTTITREQALKIIEAADEVISALAGTNEDVHPGSDNMLRLWDDLNDRYAPPEVVRELARIALASLEAEPVAWTDEEELRDVRKYGFGEIFQCPPDKYADSRRVIPLYRELPAQVVPEEIAEKSTNYPLIPGEVLSAIREVARIRADFDDFDGDRRGIGDCLDEAEQELIVTINKYASQLAVEPVVPAVLERLRTIVADPRALPRRKEWISGQQYSYVLLENVEAMVDEACRAAMLRNENI
ncbi:TPA: hypothetical protein ACU8CQ_000019 [Escherichia coli]|uniref:hypothetical protein n=1 Tax=Escherichia coli TaxID=562 RepID=UPI000DF5EC4B|nr:hypothetical protein E2855_03381 [Escherichia coli]GDL90299.1 hypothetical protein BvCmsKSP007_04995 [Escherichia coli]